MISATDTNPRSVTVLLTAICEGDRSLLAQTISMAENHPESVTLLQAQLGNAASENPHPALCVGITGPPGAGKSTMLAALVPELLSRDHTVGVLLIDPSSPMTGGAVLADRVRLKQQSHPRLYVRSLGLRNGQGGIADVTSAAIGLLKHWGADIVLVETVGAGQSDIEICRLADITMVSSPPGLGDEMQVIKAGLMEVADIFVVTKADRPGAEATAAALTSAGPGGRTRGQRPVIATSANTGEGIKELAQWLETHGASEDPTPAPLPLPAAGRRNRGGDRPEPDTQLHVRNLFDLRGQVAVITGATSGLGRRFAEVLHDAGASVVLTGRRAERLGELEQTLQRAVAVAGDITDPDHRARIVQTAMDRFGHIDVLVNNAGVSGESIAAEAFPLERWATTLDVNLSAAFAMAQLVAVPMLEQRSGSVINITSVFGLVANAPLMDAAYAATKAGLVNLTRELAVEWAKRGIRVNSIAPGWFPSEMTAGMIDDESSQRYIKRFCPMERMGQADELDGILLFLASHASSYCTGQSIAIDGGWTAR